MWKDDAQFLDEIWWNFFNMYVIDSVMKCFNFDVTGIFLYRWFPFHSWWISAIVQWLWCPKLVDVIIRSCLIAKSEGRKWHCGACNCSWHWFKQMSWSKIQLNVQYHSDQMFLNMSELSRTCCCPWKQIHVAECGWTKWSRRFITLSLGQFFVIQKASSFSWYMSWLQIAHSTYCVVLLTKFVSYSSIFRFKWLMIQSFLIESASWSRALLEI